MGKDFRLHFYECNITDLTKKTILTFYFMIFPLVFEKMTNFQKYCYIHIMCRYTEKGRQMEKKNILITLSDLMQNNTKWPFKAFLMFCLLLGVLKTCNPTSKPRI